MVNIFTFTQTGTKEYRLTRSYTENVNFQNGRIRGDKQKRCVYHTATLQKPQNISTKLQRSWNTKTTVVISVYLAWGDFETTLEFLLSLVILYRKSEWEFLRNYCRICNREKHQRFGII